MTTAPASAMPRPTKATTTCHSGRSSRSSSSSAPSTTLTIGFATETVATDGASRPVPSETCCSTKPSTPAIASAYGSQCESIVPTLSCSQSSVGLVSAAERPNSIPDAAP